MNKYDPSKDGIGLEQMNQDLARELEDVISHMSDMTCHVSAEDRVKWDNKLDVETGATATTTKNGLMSATDKDKLNSISFNANYYEHPRSGIVPGTYNYVRVDEYGHIVEAGRTESIGDAQSLGGYDASEYAKLVSPIFRGYPKLVNTPTEEDQDYITNVKFVREYVDKAAFNVYGFTERDIVNWNNKWDTNNAPVATHHTPGIMESHDKIFLDELRTTFYGVTEDTVASWNNKLSYDMTPLATTESKGFMSPADKQFIENIAIAGGITDRDINRWNNKLDIETGQIANEEENGLMSSIYVKMLKGVHNRIEVTQDMVDNWNAKLSAESAIATTANNGLMAATDRRILDRMVQNGVVDITSFNIESWNNKQDVLGIATTTKDGLMSFTDKERLDNLVATVSLNDTKVEELMNMIGTLQPVTYTTDGLMSREDKAILDNLKNSQVSEDLIIRWNDLCDSYNKDYHVTRAEANSWNNGLTYAATQSYVDSVIADKLEESDLTPIKTRIQNAENRISVNELDISSLKTNVNTLKNTQSTVGTIQGQIQDINDELDTINTNLESNQTNIDSIELDLSNYKFKLDELEENVKSRFDSIFNATDSIGTNNPEIAILDKKIVDNIKVLDDTVINRMISFDKKYVDAINAIDAKYVEEVNSLNDLTSSNINNINLKLYTTAANIVKSVNGKLEANTTLLKGLEDKLVTTINGNNNKYINLLERLIEIIKDIKATMYNELDQNTSDELDAALSSITFLEKDDNLANTTIDNNTEHVYEGPQALDTHHVTGTYSQQYTESLDHITIQTTYSNS